MLGEGDKSSFHFENCCYYALGLFFILTFASLFLTFFFLRATVELVGSVSGEVCVLKKYGGGNKMHSVFRDFYLCQCAFLGQTDQSGRRGG